MAHGTHDHAEDPRNQTVLVSVNGSLLPREKAVVSVFDSGFVLGDGIWEGLRVSGGHPAFLKAHLDRLYAGAKAIALDIGLTRDELTARIYEALSANEMRDGVHVRLMVTRGVKSTPYQDPRVTVGPATIVIIPEFKEPAPRRCAGESRCSRCTCDGPRRTPWIRSSTRTASSTTSRHASRPTPPARTRP